MEGPKELSLNEIRKYMLDNGCKVTNHSLVKHFKRFLTHPDTQIEARKEFKTYVNILATIKNENNQKYLILRKKYLTECPSEDVVQRAISQAGGGGSEAVPSSPGGVSLTSDEAMASPLRKPPPYIPPPEVSTTPTVAMYEGTPLAPMVEITHATEDDDTIKTQSEGPADNIDGQKLEAKANEEKSVSRVNSVDETANKENIPRFSFSSGSSATDSTDMGNGTGDKSSDSENPMSVKEATRKFNRMASEEEAKIISPPTKKKPEKQLIEEKELPEVTLAHPKAKEWIVAMAKASYQELAKLATDHPELVKLQECSALPHSWLQYRFGNPGRTMGSLGRGSVTQVLMLRLFSWSVQDLLLRYILYCPISAFLKQLRQLSLVCRCHLLCLQLSYVQQCQIVRFSPH
uniref:SOWAHA-C winged helix-turn-helix domain-containing protein n=1 Tax=Stomoxys calcitrans TaxID=35570 RepID=A0A1I8PM51_STOCA